MPKNEYLKVGEIKRIDGDVFVKRECYDDGLTFGYIFKDEEAYEKDWDAICYIPEACFEDTEPDEDGFCCIDCGYSHNDLLSLCNYNRELCDVFFYGCKWACPETYWGEWDEVEDIAYYYRFLKPGAKVWWNDPAGETSGEYEVYKVPFKFDEQGELDEPDNFSLDAIILIGNQTSEAEVAVNELTPVYADLISKT